MKNFTALLLASILCLQSCAQNDKEMNEKATQILSNLYKEVRHYDQRINYQADIFIGGCNLELLINDFPVQTYFDSGNGAISTSIPINTAILRPGTQTWKIRIYPIHDVTQINGVITKLPRASIEENARVEIKIEGIRYKENGDIEKHFGKVLEFKAPLIKDEKTGKNKLADAGKTYIEYSGTFEANVPYNLSGWQNSEDLRSIEPEMLKLEVVKEYEKISQWLKDRNLINIAQAKLKSKKEEAQALFYNNSTNNEYITDFIDTWGHENTKVQSLENYSLQFYGNGKIVTLISNTYKKSPLWATFKDDKNEDNYVIYSLYLHSPKGKKELEIIR
ncbi:hypothetical protein [Flavobacterium sp. FlaQc-30]|uniref:hypothetical protein n=1 Tax=Flavobacterium sp. FlaQc-30 TaxID=3374179 RepID=UPI003756D3D5